MNGNQDSVTLPLKVKIRLMRTLERQLSDIERALVAKAGLAKERVRNVTMPFLNYIDRLRSVHARYGWDSVLDQGAVSARTACA